MMATGGLFAHRGHNQGRAFKTYRVLGKRRSRACLDAFAELLSVGYEPEMAAHLVNCSGKGKEMLALLCADLGWQAQ